MAKWRTAVKAAARPLGVLALQVALTSAASAGLLSAACAADVQRLLATVLSGS